MYGTALYTGAVLGTGVLLLPALAVDRSGPASLVSWIGLVMLSVPLATTFAALASRHPNPGGVTGFAALAYGRNAGNIAGLTFYVGALLGVPSAAMIGAFYVADAMKLDHRTTTVVAAAMLVTAACVLSRGVRASGQLQVVLVATLVCLLSVAVVASLPSADGANWVPFAPHGWMAVASTASLLMFAFVGWEAVAPLSAEFRNPRRDIVVSTACALVITSVIYLGVAAMVIAVFGQDAGSSTAPIADLVASAFGDEGRYVVAVVAVVLTGGAINAYAGGAAKTGAALAQHGALPRWLQTKHDAPPVRSIGVTVGLALFVVTIIGSNAEMLQYTIGASSACFVSVYAFGAVAGMKLLEGAQRLLAATAAVFTVVLLGFSGSYGAVALGILACGVASASRERWRRSSVAVATGETHNS